MHIVEKVLAEKQVLLKTLDIGVLIRFPDITYAEAMHNDDGAVFYWVREKGEGKLSGLVRIESVDFKVARLIPQETLVIRHEYVVSVASAEFV